MTLTWVRDSDEPQFLRGLRDRWLPEGSGRVTSLGDAPEALSGGGMVEAQWKALNTPAGQTLWRAVESYDRFCAQAGHVVLTDGDVPVARTGFKARLPKIVQVGGVYTPPQVRGLGCARRAVALRRVAVRDRGVWRATLFSASDKATRACRASRFRQIGNWTLLTLKQNVVVQ